jgi:hypothetical protein
VGLYASEVRQALVGCWGVDWDAGSCTSMARSARVSGGCVAVHIQVPSGVRSAGACMHTRMHVRTLNCLVLASASDPWMTL